MKTVFLSIVVPAFNEEKNFKAGVLKPSFDFLKKVKYSWELIFVDDGSTDQTRKLLANLCHKQKRCKLISIPHGGRAAAMREGMLKAKGKYVLYTDFDQSTSLHEVERFLQSMLKNEWDLAIGTRGDGDTKRKDSLANRIRAEIFVVVARLWMGLAIKDINCGFKLYTNHAAHEIFSSLVVSRPLKIKHAYMGAIDTEILFLAKKFQYKIIELPVNWERRPFVSHIDLRKEVGTILRDLFMMRLYSYLGKYDHKVAK